jgi:hypothetical protein
MPTPPRPLSSLPPRRRRSKRSSSGPGPRWGHIGATSLPNVRDNSGHERSANVPAQRPSSVNNAGPGTTPVLSRTEEVRGSNPLTSTPTKILITGWRVTSAGPVTFQSRWPGSKWGSNRERNRQPLLDRGHDACLAPVVPGRACRSGFEASTFRLRDGCSASNWTAPEGSSLLTLPASSVQTAPDGYRRIVWMING